MLPDPELTETRNILVPGIPVVDSAKSAPIRSSAALSALYNMQERIHQKKRLVLDDSRLSDRDRKTDKITTALFLGTNFLQATSGSQINSAAHERRFGTLATGSKGLPRKVRSGSRTAGIVFAEMGLLPGAQLTFLLNSPFQPQHQTPSKRRQRGRV